MKKLIIALVLMTGCVRSQGAPEEYVYHGTLTAPRGIEEHTAIWTPEYRELDIDGCTLSVQLISPEWQVEPRVYEGRERTECDSGLATRVLMSTEGSRLTVWIDLVVAGSLDHAEYEGAR